MPLKLFLISSLVICVLSPFSAFGQKPDAYININEPSLRKIPLATPYFKAITGDATENRLSTESSDFMAKTLSFTGYFKIINREAFLENPRSKGIIAPNINFRNWTTIGAELLITGGVYYNAGVVEMELRLFDTFTGKLLIGKRYKSHADDQRRMILKFCNEVILKLTGQPGIFGSRIAFVSTVSGKKEIFVCEFDGHAPRQITRDKNIALSPAWSSDGRWLAYTSYARGKPDIYIKNLKQRRGAVISKRGTNATPAWMPGRFELAASLTFSGDPEIYLLTGNGKIIKKLTNKWGIDISPSWSPDGKKIAFVSNRSGSPQIYIKDIATGRTERLTYEGRYNTTPSWSPRGDYIAYTGSQNGVFDIYVIGVDGSLALQLTQDAGQNEAPTWSPDGSLIAFSSTREGPSRIYVMTASGTDQRRLLTLPGEQTNPKWSQRIGSN